MATLTGSSVASTYTTLLKLTTASLGADASAKYIEDAGGTDSALSLSTTRVGIGTAAPDKSLTIAHATDPHLTIMRYDASAISDTEILGSITFGGSVDSGANLGYGAAIRSYASENWDFSASNYGGDLQFYTTDNTTSTLDPRMTILDSGNVGIGTAAPNALLELDQGAGDDAIFKFVSSDVAHAMTDDTETDCFGQFKKVENAYGGLQVRGFKQTGGASAGFALALRGSLGDAAADTAKSTTAKSIVQVIGELEASNDTGAAGSNENIFQVQNYATVNFIVDAEGDLHANSGTTTDAVTVYDEYSDAQLVRAFDLSKPNPSGLINSKFDEFVKYNHEKLAELKLVGREKDGTPNHFVNVTGMQRLHNGAIWQQYTEMQKMKELMYDAMVELMGKDKADKKLESHNVTLLDKDLLN